MQKGRYVLSTTQFGIYENGSRFFIDQMGYRPYMIFTTTKIKPEKIKKLENENKGR